MKKLFFLFLLIPFLGSSQKRHENIFKPGSGFAWGLDFDFNKHFGVAPGDTVVVPAGKYPYIDIAKINGVIFINSGGVAEIGNFNLKEEAYNCKLFGNGHKGTTYGFKMNSKGNFGLGWEAFGKMEVAWIEIDGCPQGFQLLNYPEKKYKYNTQEIYFHDSYIHDTPYEAVYFGHYIAGGIFMKGKIERIKVRRAGNDGIQCRNGYFEVLFNDIDSVGLGGNDSHAQGILFGGNTKNGIAIGNKLRNIGGYGIFANGFGDFVFENNSIQSKSSGIFTKNHEPEQDLQKVGYQRFILRKNKIIAKNGKPVESYYRRGSIPSTVILEGNEIQGRPYIEPGVTFVEAPVKKKGTK